MLILHVGTDDLVHVDAEKVVKHYGRCDPAGENPLEENYRFLRH